MSGSSPGGPAQKSASTPHRTLRLVVVVVVVVVLVCITPIWGPYAAGWQPRIFGKRAMSSLNLSTSRPPLSICPLPIQSPELPSRYAARYQRAHSAHGLRRLNRQPGGVVVVVMVVVVVVVAINKTCYLL